VEAVITEELGSLAQDAAVQQRAHTGAETILAQDREAAELVSDFEASWGGLTPVEKRETMHSIVESAFLTWRPDGHFEIAFAIRG
jgi:hypothetical protein